MDDRLLDEYKHILGHTYIYKINHQSVIVLRYNTNSVTAQSWLLNLYIIIIIANILNMSKVTQKCELEVTAFSSSRYSNTDVP